MTSQKRQSEEAITVGGGDGGVVGIGTGEELSQDGAAGSMSGRRTPVSKEGSGSARVSAASQMGVVNGE